MIFKKKQHNLDAGIEMADRQIKNLQSQMRSIQTMIDMWQGRKDSMIKIKNERDATVN